MTFLKQERFARLQFPVHKLQAKNPTELFEILPGLRRYFQRVSETSIEVKQPLNASEKVAEKVMGYPAKYRGIFPEDLVRIIKYIVFVYDPETDLLNEYPDDPRLLKDAAAKEAGFRRTKDGEWPNYVQDILDFKQKEVVEWIIDYLKIKKNSIWTEIKFCEEELELLYRSRSTAMLSGKIEHDSMKWIRERLEQKEKLYSRFYSEHSDLKQATEDEIYPISPENVFKELKIPDSVWRTRQARDVPKDTGGQQTHN